MRTYDDGEERGGEAGAPPQVPRGPMPEEATEEERRRWAAAHVSNYVIDPEREEAELHAGHRSLLRREAAQKARAAAILAAARNAAFPPLPPRRRPASVPAPPPAPGPPTSWVRMVLDAEDRRLGTETVVRARARQRAAAAAAANEEARSC
jgi:hypothetical protein